MKITIGQTDPRFQPSLAIIWITFSPKDHLPKPTFLLFLLLLKLPINNLQRRIAFRHSRRQILIPILRNQNIILDPDSTNRIVLIKQILINILGVLRVFEVDFFEGVAGEVTVGKMGERDVAFEWIGGAYIPGSTVMTIPGSSKEGFAMPMEKYAVSQSMRYVDLKP